MSTGESTRDWEVQGIVPGIPWPALPSEEGAKVLSLLLQFNQTQWLDTTSLQALQLRQLDTLLKHAWLTVPWYREHWHGIYEPDAPLDMARFRALPVLSRGDVQTHGQALKSTAMPAAHGDVMEVRSSGSTGMPVRVMKSQLMQLYWNAFTLRDHLWQKRDLRGKLVAIRHGVSEGESGNWGAATEGLIATGPSAVAGVGHDLDTLLEWLQAQRPDYLLTYPSLAAALATRALERGLALPTLRQLRTFGEILDDETRRLCREAWDIGVSDAYSAEEVGYIALQCPEHEHYHVQAEDVLVEVLDEAGRACAPGGVGRVVVTSLHNFAMPLLRYELGDYAEVGAPCPCGRGLPVLKRVLGRVRNMLVTADGKRYWPTFALRDLVKAAPVSQAQFAQTGFDQIEARLVTTSRLTSVQEDSLRRVILSRLPDGFEVRFDYREQIPRSAGGKFEDFVSEIAPRAMP